MYSQELLCKLGLSMARFSSDSLSNSHINRRLPYNPCDRWAKSVEINPSQRLVAHEGISTFPPSSGYAGNQFSVVVCFIARRKSFLFVSDHSTSNNEALHINTVPDGSIVTPSSFVSSQRHSKFLVHASRTATGRDGGTLSGLKPALSC